MRMKFVPLDSPVPSWCSPRYSLGWPSTAARSSCWSCPSACAQLWGPTWTFNSQRSARLRNTQVVSRGSHLRCAELVASRLWTLAELPAFCNTHSQPPVRAARHSKADASVPRLSLKLWCHYAMYGWVRGAIVLWLDPVRTSCGDIIT